MGVLTCDREGCGNIMCDRYSYKYGYICDDCFSELIASGIDTDILTFMRSAKLERDTIDPLEYFNAIFDDRRLNEI